VSNSPQTYNGSPQSATVAISASSVPGAVANVNYNGSAPSPTNAATYAATADFVPTDTTNYNTLPALSAGNFVIDKATPTATPGVSNSPQTYNGSPQSATVADLGSSVPGTVANVLTGRRPSRQRRHLCGDGRLRADRHDQLQHAAALSAGNFVIDKATPTATLAVSNSPQTYNGSPQSATVAISAARCRAGRQRDYNGRRPSDKRRHLCGDGRLRADRHDQLQHAAALSAGNFVIDKATPTATLAVSNSPQTYTGSPQSATVAISAARCRRGRQRDSTVGDADKRRHLCGDGRLRADRHDQLQHAAALSAGNFVIDKATPTATLA
jgi:uncharacterized protein (DUF1778 family)